MLAKTLNSDTGWQLQVLVWKTTRQVWKNRHVSIEVKCNVYQGVVLSALLCGAETCMDYTSA